MLYFFLISLFNLHAFHLSNTEINYNEDSNSLQIASKVFIDDLEDELKLHGHTKLHIATPREAENVDSILFEYFFENLQFRTDVEHKEMEFIGKETSEDLIAIWVYIEIFLADQPSQLQIKNTILTDLYDDQKNMIILKKNNKMIEHETLDYKNTELNISL